MEYDLMSASFANICVETFEESDSREKRMGLVSNVERAAESEIAVTVIRAPDLTCFVAPSAHESFKSIVNASNCANANSENILEAYVTLTKQAAFLRSYMY